MRDAYGRKIDYLRISITDRCNLRCVYCMPKEGVSLIPMEEILTYEEIIRICKVAASMGLKHIKITGGEPLARSKVEVLIGSLKEIPGIRTVTLTTNGTLLERYMERLVQAGIDGINISLDSLEEEQYRTATRGGEVSEVIKGIRSAISYPQVVVKINCVLDQNWKENTVAVAKLGRDLPLHIRFIEQMPLVNERNAEQGHEQLVLDLFKQTFGNMTFYDSTLGSGPSRYYSLEGFQGKIGFISAISHKFCHTCNRVRLTAEGKLRLCLQSGEHIDLKKYIRGGCTDQELEAHILEGLLQKPKEHHMVENRIQAGGMSQIGG